MKVSYSTLLFDTENPKQCSGSCVLLADQYHGSSRSILIRSTIHIEDRLICIFLSSYRSFTIFYLNLFHYLDIIHRASYFDCIKVDELCYEVGKGLPLDCCLGVIVYVKLPQIITHLSDLPEASGF